MISLKEAPIFSTAAGSISSFCEVNTSLYNLTCQKCGSGSFIEAFLQYLVSDQQVSRLLRSVLGHVLKLQQHHFSHNYIIACSNLLMTLLFLVKELLK